MPKTKNITRAQWDHATRPTTTTNNNENTPATTSTTLRTALASALSPPTRPRPHASRTNSTTTMSAGAARHRRSKENAENGGGEKENSGRVGRSTRTHVTPGVLSTAFVSSNVSAGFTSTAVLGGGKKALVPASVSKPPPKPTLVKRRVKKQPLQDVTAQFVASGMGEGANRAGTAYEQLGEEDILALREQAANDVALDTPAVEERVATPARGRRNRAGGAEPTSPLPPSSPPSDYRLPSSLNFNLAASMPLAAREPASPAHSIPVPEYDPWDSFDSAPPVGSPTRPVLVAEARGEDDGVDREDPFGFAALERKLKANRDLLAPIAQENDAEAPMHADENKNEEEDEDIDSLLVADTSSPRPESMLLRRHHQRNVLKRALEEELDEEDADAAAHTSFRAGSSPILLPARVRGAVLSSPVRAAIAAAGPASTPAAAGGASSPVHAHAHFATPPTPHKETHKRRRISGVPDANGDGAVAHDYDVFGPCLPTSSSSPGKLEAESPSPSKSSRKVRAQVSVTMEGGEAGAALADALDVFNATQDAHEDTAAVDADEAVGRTLRPRPSRAHLPDEDARRGGVKGKKTRSASRGRGRGLGRGTSRGRARGASYSRGRGRRAQVQKEKDGADDREEEEVDQDERFEQERQARIAYFRGLDDYEVETEDVYLI